jgi:hypothetical protein
MIPVIINKINPGEFRKYFSNYEQRRVKNQRGVAENLLSPSSMLLPFHGTCEPRPKNGRQPGPATQKNYQLPGDQAQGHREGQSIKPLPFECNLNAAGGRAKFATARAAPPGLPG